MPILLSDDERDEVLFSHKMYPDICPDLCVAMGAKAQLKKIVEWLGTFEFYEDWGGESGRDLRDTIVEALKKEVFGNE